MVSGVQNLKVWGSIPHGDLEFFSLSHACDKDEKNILLFFFTKLKAYHLSILSTNIMLSTLLILAVCRRHVIWCIRARNLKVWGLIPYGDSDLFFFVPHLWQDGKKTYFSNFKNVITYKLKVLSEENKNYPLHLQWLIWFLSLIRPPFVCWPHGFKGEQCCWYFGKRRLCIVAKGCRQFINLIINKKLSVYLIRNSIFFNRFICVSDNNNILRVIIRSK